jgi:hypothetical protein
MPWKHPQVLGVDLNHPESSRPPLPFAPPHNGTPSCSKGRLIRCTVHLSCASTEVAYAVIMRPAAVELTAIR